MREAPSNCETIKWGGSLDDNRLPTNRLREVCISKFISLDGRFAIVLITLMVIWHGFACYERVLLPSLALTLVRYHMSTLMLLPHLLQVDRMGRSEERRVGKGRGVR